MISSLALCWFGVGLLLVADPARMERVLGRSPAPLVSWLLRGLGTAALVASAWALRSELSGALVPVAALLGAMATCSLVSLFAPLRPRLYALTIPASALVAAASLLVG